MGRMPNGFLRKNVLASSGLNYLLLEIDLCLTLILSFNLKHALSNEAVKHDVLGDYIICVEASKGYDEALRQAESDCFR